MILRLLICIAMSIFAFLQGFQVVSSSAEKGSDYFLGIYIIVVILLFSGLNKRGLITWPIASVLLLLKGHIIVGWIPVALVIFNLIGNEIIHSTKKENL